MTPLDVVFAGSSEFAVSSLRALGEAGHRIVSVLTQPDRPAGRRRRLAATPVKLYAESLGLPVLQPVSLREPPIVERLAEMAPDVIVVVDYGLMIPSAVLALPRLGCVNGHASLLPRWRGAAPIERAILAGDRGTGISVMQMDEGLDTGDVLLVRRMAIHDSESAGDLRVRLAELCGHALVDGLAMLADGTAEPRPQDTDGVRYASKLGAEEARLDWEEAANLLARKVRAFNPRPGAYCFLRSQRMKVLEATAVAEGGTGAPGDVYRTGRDGIDVTTGDGSLRLTRVQLPGGRPLTAAEFLNGHPILGERLE